MNRWPRGWFGNRGFDRVVTDLGDLGKLLLPSLWQVFPLRYAAVLDDITQTVVDPTLPTQSILDDPLDVEAFDVIDKLSLDKNIANVFLGVFVPNLSSLEELLDLDVAVLISYQGKEEISVARWARHGFEWASLKFTDNQLSILLWFFRNFSG
jgi:hypothetical protein